MELLTSLSRVFKVVFRSLICLLMSFILPLRSLNLSSAGLLHMYAATTIASPNLTANVSPNDNPSFSKLYYVRSSISSLISSLAHLVNYNCVT